MAEENNNHNHNNGLDETGGEQWRKYLSLPPAERERKGKESRAETREGLASLPREKAEAAHTALDLRQTQYSAAEYYAAKLFLEEMVKYQKIAQEQKARGEREDEHLTSLEKAEIMDAYGGFYGVERDLANRVEMSAELGANGLSDEAVTSKFQDYYVEAERLVKT